MVIIFEAFIGLRHLLLNGLDIIYTYRICKCCLSLHILRVLGSCKTPCEEIQVSHVNVIKLSRIKYCFYFWWL